MAKRKPYRKRYRRRSYRRRGDDTMQNALMLVFVLGLLYAGFSALNIKAIALPTVATNLAQWFDLLVSVFFITGGVIVLYLLYKVARKLHIKIEEINQKQHKRKTNREAYERRRTVSEYMQMDPFDFEHQVAWLYEQYGYKTQVTQARIDGGIDVVMTNDEERVAVQVKRYAARNYVQRQEVQAFYGSFVDEGFDRGVMVTTSQFSDRAKVFAADKNIELVDGAGLEKLRNY